MSKLREKFKVINCSDYDIVTDIFKDYSTKQNELIENLIKERLCLLKVEYNNFLDFVKDNLSISYSPKETIIFYKKQPLLTYWFEMQTPDFKNEKYTLTSIFYYK